MIRMRSQSIATRYVERVMGYQKKEMAVTFNSAFDDRHACELEQFLGRDLTLELSPQFLRTSEAEWKPEFRQEQGRGATVQPAYEFKRGDVEVTDHWTNFLDCERARQATRRRGSRVRRSSGDRHVRRRLTGASAALTWIPSERRLFNA
jgi:hypothetical protein